MQRDEYGDQVLRAQDTQDPSSKEVLRQGEKLKAWLEEIQRERIVVENFKSRRVVDKAMQTEDLKGPI